MSVIDWPADDKPSRLIVSEKSIELYFAYNHNNSIKNSLFAVNINIKEIEILYNRYENSHNFVHTFCR